MTHQPINKPSHILNSPFEIWTTSQTKKLLNQKHVCFIGDSIQRMCYKDLVALLNNNFLCDKSKFRTKGEPSFYNDTMVDRSKIKSNGTDYFEIREYFSDDFSVRVTFYFVTRIYSEYVQQVIFDYFLKEKLEYRPDIYVVNSTVWDIGKFGVNSVNDFKINFQNFVDKISEVVCLDSESVSKEIPNKTLKTSKKPLAIWRNALPTANFDLYKVLDIPAQEVAESKICFRLDIPKVNQFVTETINKLNHPLQNNFVILDCHDYFVDYMDTDLAHDGIHWSNKMHRILSCMILSLIRRSLGYERNPCVFHKLMIGPMDDQVKRASNVRKAQQYDIESIIDFKNFCFLSFG